MWIFTKHGMLSCVCGSQRPDPKNHKAKAKLGPDLDVFMVRSRELEALEGIVQLMEASDLYGAMDRRLALTDIKVSEHNDYRFRLIFTRADFERLLVILSRDVQYTNFKSEVMRHQGPTLYERALHTVWGILYRVQTSKYGKGIYGFGDHRDDRRAPGHPTAAEEAELAGVDDDEDAAGALARG